MMAEATTAHEAAQVSHVIASPPSSSLDALIAGVPSAATVVAVTDDGSDERYRPVREQAAQVAVGVGGTLLFCVAPLRAAAARSRPRLFFPGSGEGRPHTGTRARDLLAEEARAVTAPGLTVAVWLPSRAGPSGVAEAVLATGAALVLVPARARRANLLDRTLEYLASRVPAPVVAVAPDRSWRLVPALVARSDTSWQPSGTGPRRLVPGGL